MSRNGELCLKKVIISYCPNRGSPNTRQFIATHLPRFHAKYPSVTIDIRPRLWAETSITGLYRDGSERSYKTKYMSSMGIWLRFHRLVNTANDYDLPFSASHLHFQRRSVQGTWNPWLWHYETDRRRTETPQWRRKLSEEEWDYYLGQYSAQMKQEEEAIQQRVAEHTEIPLQNTREVQERWKKHVLPRLQTDMEFNLSHYKRQHARGQRHEPVTMGEYRLFSVPDHREIGQDAVDMMRRREAKHQEEWWQHRKSQLKPPK
ncbi:hypothetical protein C3747_313g21 [Trypanosoma cruzi]|uniref:Large ribosomal subunit protein mL43 n=1 Tax=Trypanosoma cruzi TaxID=5693 RepID=A0A2V2VEB6_TRYCR|nr:putative Mitochondrial ribosomal protein L51 / S25 / CI-B8 domain containing protein [Trypanosoma cruzi]PWU92663.1 hypothetical protein C3747_313g21 [Trypanosoma cruzi]